MIKNANQNINEISSHTGENNNTTFIIVTPKNKNPFWRGTDTKL